MGNPNWSKLVNEGRAKDFGIPWNDEELNALYKLEIPADYVRDGVLTSEGYAKALEKEAKDGKKSLNHSSVEELTQQAIGLGIKLTPDVSKDALVKAIKSALELKKAKAEQAESIKKANDDEEKAIAKAKASALLLANEAFEKEKAELAKAQSSSIPEKVVEKKGSKK